MRNVIEYQEVINFVDGILGPAFHQKQCLAIANAVLGACHADRLSIAAVGRAMAAVRRTSPKHAIKQVDRLLSNGKIDMATAFGHLVPWIVGKRKRIDVVMDWTEYAADGHSRIAISLLTNHGRATPLVWLTVCTDELKNWRNVYEDFALDLLWQSLPPDVNVTLLADRGFGDVKLYEFLRKFGWDYVIRFRGVIEVQSAEGEVRRACDWVPTNGQPMHLPGARVTRRRIQIGAVVCVHEPGMKDPWILATSLPDPAPVIIRLYGRRFTIEEGFRDEKDRRFGLGLSETTIEEPKRRDRLLLVGQLATLLLTLLGAAGEEIGLDRQLRANTETHKRTHSLFRQGREYIAGVAQRALDSLRDAFQRLLVSHSNGALTHALL